MDSGAHTQATTHPPLVRRVQGCRRRVAQAPSRSLRPFGLGGGGWGGEVAS